MTVVLNVSNKASVFSWGIWVYGCMGIWVYGYMGYMGIWVYGVYGYMGDLTIPSRFFKYRWVSQKSKEGAVSIKIRLVNKLSVLCVKEVYVDMVQALVC